MKDKTIDDPAPTAASLLSGELDDDTFDQVLARAEEDDEADRELDLVADLVAVAEAEGEAMLAPPPARRGGHLLLLVTGIAAAAVILLLWRPFAGDGGIERLAPPAYLPATLRGSESGLGDAFHLAMKPYARGDHAASVASLDAFLAEHPDHLPATFYRAVGLEEQGRPDEARAAYLTVAAAGAGKLADHASWRLAHLSLAEGDEVRARVILKLLQAGEGEFAPNAAALLERLETR